LLASSVAKLGRTEEANATDRKVLALQPSFSSSRYCSAVGITPELAETLMEAWRQAVLPP